MYRSQSLKITEKVSFNIASEASYVYIFNQLLSTQNVNVARFARNVDETLSEIFKHREHCGLPLDFTPYKLRLK